MSSLNRFIFALVCIPMVAYGLRIPELSTEQIQRIGYAIFQNETGGSHDNLTWWGERENFASLGIGHFIWYPVVASPKYAQTFPELVRFIRSKNHSVPAWLVTACVKGCPWRNRTHFLKEFNNVRMEELRAFLAHTMSDQALFMVERFKILVPKIMERVPQFAKKKVEQRIEFLAQSPQGIYALIDYTNWKGGGTLSTENYKKQGWGLFHVLMAMNDGPGNSVEDFARAAREVIKRRVRNAPSYRHEEKWLPGWLNRIDTYTKPLPAYTLS